MAKMTLNLTSEEQLHLFGQIAADRHEAHQHVKMIEGLPNIHDLLPSAKKRAAMLDALYEKLVQL